MADVAVVELTSAAAKAAVVVEVEIVVVKSIFSAVVFVNTTSQILFREKKSLA